MSNLFLKLFNQNFINTFPTHQLRQAVKRAKGHRYSRQAEAKLSRAVRKPDVTYDLDPTDQVFHTITQKDLNDLNK